MIGFMNKTQIDNLLRSEVIGRIGCAAEGKVYVVPITFVYDGTCILAHTALGLKVDMMRSNPKVCFEVDHVYNMANWQSVIVWGTYEELKGKEEEDALQQIINRIHPLITSETSVPRHGLERPHAPVNPHIQLVVFKINITEATGKFEKQ
jgi:nitroimidazol reductase NimA-like FMN-containing flavoprotein (pyridoxamine 5'-phosphate oxidase superfamily)